MKTDGTALGAGGYGLVAKDVMRDTAISIKAKALYAYLCVYAGDAYYSYPSIELITHELQITKTSFYKYLDELIAAGYIQKRKLKPKGSEFTNNAYILKTHVP